MAKDRALQNLIQRRKTAAIIPSVILTHFDETKSKLVEELAGQKEYLTFLKNSEKVSNLEYKVSTSTNRISELRDSFVRLHIANREAIYVGDFLENTKGKPEETILAQQRIAELSDTQKEIEEALGSDGKQEVVEEEEVRETNSQARARTQVDLSLVTRLAGSGLRVGPMHFRLIAGQLERTYMNMVQITTDKEDTKKFIRAVKRFFLPPGRTLANVGLDHKWLNARGFTDKQIEELIG